VHAKRLTLNDSATVYGCGLDHATTIRKELDAARQLEDEALHPWRYSGKREDAGIPLKKALSLWVFKNLDNPTASYTGIELNNLRKGAKEKEEIKERDVVGSNAGYSIASSALAQPGSVS